MAVEWYKKSSDSGNAFALHSLGYCYQYGIGTEIDEVEVRLFILHIPKTHSFRLLNITRNPLIYPMRPRSYP